MEDNQNPLMLKESPISGSIQPYVQPSEQKFLYQLFEQSADEFPQQVAVENPDQSLTYQALDRLSNQYAHFFLNQGLRPGELVGFYYLRSVEAIVAMLGCLKAGLGYVPIDPSVPEERIQSILFQSKCRFVLTQSDLSQKIRSLFSGDVLPTDLLSSEIKHCSSTRLSPLTTGTLSTHVAYVIFTSGTTGKPKGVVAEQRHVYDYVKAFNEVCSTHHEDRIYQGFSLGFDGSIEEIWMAFSNGATLVTPLKETATFGNELGQYLLEQRVTYFSTVPTLLSTIDMELPLLRQIVVSGEACPSELVEKWDREYRDVLNVYGPTEACVNTTLKKCKKGEPVTIGQPLPGYELYVFDQDWNEVERGEKGELFVGGTTLARGYLHQAVLTQEKFVTHPRLQERLYRTGDLVRWNSQNELEFFGRIDGQVKIRGYRIELGEIEQVLLENPSIQTASVKVVEVDGLKQIAAYVLLEPDAELCRLKLHQNLTKKLPHYMVPAYLEVLDCFPRLASGKVDRRAFPDPVTPFVLIQSTYQAPRTGWEKKIAQVCEKVMGLEKVSIESHFFHDLGGYSLVAAQVVTLLRDEMGMDVSIRNFYEHPSVEALAGWIQSQSKDEGKQEAAPVFSSEQRYLGVPRWERGLTKTLQLASIFSAYLIGTIPFSIFVFVANSIYVEAMTLLEGSLWIIGTSILSWPVMLFGAVVSKWVLIGRYQAGEHPVWGLFYFRWWLAGKISDLSGASLLSGTPLMSLYYRLMGARVGRGCFIDSIHCSAWDMVSLGDGASINADSQILGCRIEDGLLKIAPISIGAHCTVGGHATLGLSTSMEEGAFLEEQSYLPDGQTMGAHECWGGSPATFQSQVPHLLANHTMAWTKPKLWSLAFLATLFFNGLVALVTFTGAMVASYLIYLHWGGSVLSLILFASVPVGVVTLCFLFGVIRRVVMPRAETGEFHIQSMHYLRRWYLDGLMRVSREVLKPLYTTLYFPTWLRWMGAKVGRRAEISTLWYCSPELVNIEDESFFADGCIIGGKQVSRGTFYVGLSHIGKRSFIGNGALLPTGKTVGHDCLIGVLSTTPSQATQLLDQTEWLGSPAFQLPYRKKNEDFGVTETFAPSRSLYFKRAIIDGLRLFLPSYIAMGALTVEVGSLIALFWFYGLSTMVLFSPVVTFLTVMLTIASVVGLKRVIMGKFKPTTQPLWCTYIWWNEFINGLYETLMAPLLFIFKGTPFIAFFLRSLGVKVGKNTYIDSILISEFDLIEIGDYSALNTGSVLQTHLFEDRVFKSSSLEVGKGCSVGNMSIALYDTKMGEGSKLGPLSLLMKGEKLAPHTSWHGIPTEQIG